MLRPHSKNVPGPFFVDDGCCTACGMPEQEAPELFGWDNGHCFVKKQPHTDGELDQMLEAVLVADLRCIFYRGCDPEIIRRLVDIDEGCQVVRPLPEL